MAASPFIFLAPLNGTLAFQDRAGGGTLTGAGAVRYQAASGARTNYVFNTSAIVNTALWAVLDGSLSRVATDGVNTGTCFEYTSSATSGTYVSPPSGGCKVNGSVQVTVSFYAKLVSGASDWNLYALERNAAGGGGGNVLVSAFTPTTEWQRFSYTYTVAAGLSHSCPWIRRASAVAGTVRFTDVQLETGSTATAYFDGSTGGVWLDPITGILGTAHASPSVSQAVAWVEEGTTNTIPDPSFEAAVITTSWAVNGGTGAIAKVTTHAYIGSNAARVTCGAAADGIGQLNTTGGSASSGQSWTVSARVRAFAAGDVGKTVYFEVNERTVANALVATNTSGTFSLTDAWQSVSYTVALAGGGTVAKVTCKILGSAACDFVLDAVQLEQKAYATSYADGSLGSNHSISPFYGWNGTQHASSSYRTATTISFDPSVSNRVSLSKGGVYAKVSASASASIDQYAFGHIISTSRIYLARQYLSGFAYARIGNGSGLTSTAMAVNTWYSIGSEWTGADYRSTNGIDVGSYASYATLDTLTTNAYIGSQSTSAGFLNGLIGPVAIANRPLTTKERAKLYAKTTWVWSTLKSGFRHGRVV